MEEIANAEFIGEPFDSLERVYGVVLPSFATVEDIRAESIAKRFSDLRLGLFFRSREQPGLRFRRGC